MPTPLYNDETHSYRTREGRKLPSVTQILSGVCIINSQWFDEQSAWRGSVIHKVCELDDKGTLLESSIDPAAMPYLDAWRRYKQNMRFKFTLIEQPLYHPQLFYAGTPDRIGEDFILDLKTGAAQEWHGLQLSGYAHLTPFPRKMRRYTVRLKPDGSYVIAEYEPATASGDWAVFQSALNVHNWKEK